MIRRIAIVPILCLSAIALTGGTAAVAKKRPPPKIKVGSYLGTTSPDGVNISVALDPGRASGSIFYCSMTAPFTVSGKSFSVVYLDPVSGDSISASGTFKAKRKRSGKVAASVAGSVGPNGCDSTPQTFALRR
jgi:hypothetical protein